MTKCGIFAQGTVSPAHFFATTLRILYTALPLPLLLTVRITFITICKKGCQVCHDDIGAVIFHMVSKDTLTYGLG